MSSETSIAVPVRVSRWRLFFFNYSAQRKIWETKYQRTYEDTISIVHEWSSMVFLQETATVNSVPTLRTACHESYQIGPRQTKNPKNAKDCTYVSHRLFPTCPRKTRFKEKYPRWRIFNLRPPLIKIELSTLTCGIVTGPRKQCWCTWRQLWMGSRNVVILRPTIKPRRSTWSKKKRRSRQRLVCLCLAKPAKGLENQGWPWRRPRKPRAWPRCPTTLCEQLFKRTLRRPSLPPRTPRVQWPLLQARCLHSTPICFLSK